MATVPVDYLNIRPLLGSVVIQKQLAAALTPALGKLCYVNDDGKLALTNGASAPTVASRQLGLIVATGRANPAGNAAADETVTFLEFGRVYLGPAAALDEGRQYYVSNTAGGIEDAPGTVVRRIGAPEDSTILFFNPTVAASGS